MIIRALIAFTFGASLLAISIPQAEAGCICPSLSEVRTGSLKVSGATIESQSWTLRNNEAKVTLSLSGVSKATAIEVLVMAALVRETKDLAKLARRRGYRADNSADRLKAPKGFAFSSTVSEHEEGVFRSIKERWKASKVPSDKVTLELSWQFPAAGDDWVPLGEKPFERAYCIDRGTKRAMKKATIHGYLAVDFVLSPDMAKNLTLRIERQKFPISLCADNVEKRGKNAFEIKGRENLKARDGVLQVVFTESI